MVGEDLQTRIIRDIITSLHILILHCSHRWIHSRFQESIMTVIIVRPDQSRDRETVLHYQLHILVGRFQQLLQVSILWLIMVTGLLPLMNMLSQPHTNIEVSIQKQDHVGFHALNIQYYWNGFRVIQSILQQSWLNHYQGIRHVLSRQTNLNISILRYTR